jgi:GNAT superfamily N-acetyltransferase
MKDLEFHPASAKRWDDLAQFFKEHGNTNYCWCQRWRLKSTEYRDLKAVQRRQKLSSLLDAGVPIGVLGYYKGKMAGWCSMAPRETYALLESSTTLKRIDDQPVWSVVCFFIAPEMRGQGFSVQLLKAAVKYAISEGATVIEGYPVEPDQSYRFMGSPAMFRQAGFKDAATAKNGRKIVRYEIKEMS